MRIAFLHAVIESKTSSPRAWVWVTSAAGNAGVFPREASDIEKRLKYIEEPNEDVECLEPGIDMLEDMGM